jgi:hypothetical protein
MVYYEQGETCVVNHRSSSYDKKKRDFLNVFQRSPGNAVVRRVTTFIITLYVCIDTVLQPSVGPWPLFQLTESIHGP